MKQFKSIICISIISTLMLGSCKKDDTFSPAKPQPEPVAYTVSAQLNGFISTDGNNQALFIPNWNAQSKISLWAGNFDQTNIFTIDGYDEAKPSNIASFKSETIFSDNVNVIAIYPSKDVVISNNSLQLNYSGKQEQAGSDFDYQSSMLMLAKGNITDNKLSELSFQNLTSVLEFTFNNKTEYSSIRLKSIQVESDKYIFPSVIDLDINGNITRYSGTLKSISLALNGQELTTGENNLKGYLNFLTPSAESVSSETRLTVKIIAEVKEGETPKEVSFTCVNDLLKYIYPEGTVIANDRYKFITGKYYNLPLEIRGKGTEITGPGYEDGETIEK